MSSKLMEQEAFKKALNCNPPDYDKAKSILANGLDINAPMDDDEEENLLSSLILGYWMDENDKRAKCYLVDIIKFMIENGLDLTKDGGRYGAMCLYNLTFSTYDENVVYAAKLLLDNGARNIEFGKDDSPLGAIGTEASYLNTCEEDSHLGNIYDTLYEIVDCADKGKDYHNIDLYFEAKEKSIHKVFKVKDERGIFELNSETSNHKNCFESRICFDMGDLFLVVDKWAGLTCYKQMDVEIEDISALFKDYIGKTIKDFEFSYKEVEKGQYTYGQQTAKIILDDGSAIVFSDNYGEMDDGYVGYFGFEKEDKTMEEKKELTQNEKDLIGLMAAMGFEEQYVVGAFAYLKEEFEREKLLKYLLFKGKYATASDSLGYCGAIERAGGKRYQYLPQNLFVRFIKETTDELNQGDYYQVHTVYGVKDIVYYMMNEKDEMKEYPASDFIRLRPSLVTYTGIPDDNGGETEVTEGFELGKEYVVVDEHGMDYVLEDGRTVPFYETDEIEFVPAEIKPLRPIKHEVLLQILRNVLEFGDMHRLYDRMTDETVYISHGKNLTIVGRDKIYDYIEEISKARVEQDAFSDVVICTVTEDDDNGHKKCDRFLMMLHDDKTRTSAFIYDDGTFVTKIELSEGWPAYKCDETEINKLGKKEGD